MESLKGYIKHSIFRQNQKERHLKGDLTQVRDSAKELGIDIALGHCLFLRVFSIKITVEVPAISGQFQFLSICPTAQLKGRSSTLYLIAA